MASPYDRYGDSDDYFAHTRMSFGDHLDELRTHLLRAIGWLLCGMVVAFCFGGTLLAMITNPITKESAIYRADRVERARKDLDANRGELARLNTKTNFIKLLIPKSALEEALRGKDPGSFVWKDDASDIPEGTRAVSEDETLALPVSISSPALMGIEINRPLSHLNGDDQLSTLSIQEPAIVYIKVCLVAGIIFASPLIFWEIWSFVASGLYPHEKQYVYGSLPFAIGLFLGGALGNLVDRLFRAPGPLRGAVVDFVRVGGWPLFNLADSAITVGAVVVAIAVLRERPGTAAPAAAEEQIGRAHV